MPPALSGGSIETKADPSERQSGQIRILPEHCRVSMARTEKMWQQKAARTMQQMLTQYHKSRIHVRFREPARVGGATNLLRQRSAASKCTIHVDLKQKWSDFALFSSFSAPGSVRNLPRQSGPAPTRAAPAAFRRVLSKMRSAPLRKSFLFICHSQGHGNYSFDNIFIMDTQILPEQRFTVDAAGGWVSYEDSGDFSESSSRPIIICLPGIGDLRSSYRLIVPLLNKAGYRTICMDLRGLGGSSTQFDDFSAESVGRDVVSLVLHLRSQKDQRKRKFFLLGNSMTAAASVYAAAELGKKKVPKVVMTGPFVRDAEMAFGTATFLRVLLGASI